MLDEVGEGEERDEVTLRHERDHHDVLLGSLVRHWRRRRREQIAGRRERSPLRTPLQFYGALKKSSMHSMFFLIKKISFHLLL